MRTGTLLDNRGADEAGGVPPSVVTGPLPGCHDDLAMGDEEGAERALDYLFETQQKADGSFPQNSNVDGTPRWENTSSMRSLPSILAWQLGCNDRRFTMIKSNPRRTTSWPTDRYPAGAVGEPGRLLAGYHRRRDSRARLRGRDCAQANGDQKSAETYRAKADEWQENVEIGPSRLTAR